VLNKLSTGTTLSLSHYKTKSFETSVISTVIKLENEVLRNVNNIYLSLRSRSNYFEHRLFLPFFDGADKFRRNIGKFYNPWKHQQIPLKSQLLDHSWKLKQLMYLFDVRSKARTTRVSSSAQTLGSWLRITLEVWMSVCVYFVFRLLSCMCRYRPCDRLIPSPRSLVYCVEDQGT
jgi:hypothetical protein